MTHHALELAIVRSAFIHDYTYGPGGMDIVKPGTTRLGWALFFSSKQDIGAKVLCRVSFFTVNRSWLCLVVLWWYKCNLAQHFSLNEPLGSCHLVAFTEQYLDRIYHTQWHAINLYDELNPIKGRPSNLSASVRYSNFDHTYPIKCHNYYIRPYASVHFSFTFPWIAWLE